MGTEQEKDFDLDEIRRMLKSKDRAADEPIQPQEPAPQRQAPRRNVRQEKKPVRAPRSAAPGKKPVRRDRAQEMLLENQRDAQEENAPKGFDTFTMLHDIVCMLAVVTVIFVFFFRLVAVSGSSMYPTFVDRDWLILESNFLYRNVERGDVVVLSVESPVLDGPIVKRVIAIEGQTVDINFDTGAVYVDGQLQIEPYIYEPTYLSRDQEYPLTVPEGCIFVMGDNRNNSLDSRATVIGCVPTERVLGRVLFMVFPGRQTDEYGNVTGKRQFSRIGAIS